MSKHIHYTAKQQAELLVLGLLQEKQKTASLKEALDDIETLSRPDDAEAQGAKVYRDNLLDDIGKIARAAIAKAKS